MLIGIEAAQFDVAGGDERTTLALGAEPQVFQVNQRHRGEGVCSKCHVDIRGTNASRCVSLFTRLDRTRLGQAAGLQDAQVRMGLAGAPRK